MVLAFKSCGGRSEEVITLGCGPGDEGSIPSAHPIFSIEMTEYYVSNQGRRYPRYSGTQILP